SENGKSVGGLPGGSLEIRVGRDHQILAIARQRERAGEWNVDRSPDGLVGGVHDLHTVGRIVGDVQHSAALVESDIGGVPADGDHLSKESAAESSRRKSDGKNAKAQNWDISHVYSITWTVIVVAMATGRI